MRRKSNNHNLIKSGNGSFQKVQTIHGYAISGRVKFSQPVQHTSKLLYQQPAEYKMPGFLKDLLETK